GADVRGLGALGDELADLGRGGDIRRRFLHRFVEGRSRGERAARHVVDHLGVNVLVRIVHGQTGTLGGPGDSRAGARVSASASSLASELAHEVGSMAGYLPTPLPSLRRTCSPA